LSIIPLKNECFCGSGRKYESCHYKKIFRHPAEIQLDMQKTFGTLGTCIAIESGSFCGKPAIKSHSIQKKNSIDAIATSGHVCAFPNGPHGRVGNSNRAEFELIGVSKASTFPGFCSRHDHGLFTKIESPPIKNNYRNALTTAFRAHCYESVNHTNGAFFNWWLRNDANFDFPFDAEIIAPEAENMRAYAAYCWRLKHYFELVISRKTTKKFFFVAAILNKSLPFSTTGSFCTETDFSGRRLKDFRKAGNYNYAQLWVLPQKNNTTYVGLSGIDDQDSKYLIRFLKSFIFQEPKTMADSLFKAALVHSENTFISPSFIETLTTDQKHSLLAEYERTTLGSLNEVRDEDCLTKEYPIHLNAEPYSIINNLNR